MLAIIWGWNKQAFKFSHYTKTTCCQMKSHPSTLVSVLRVGSGWKWKKPARNKTLWNPAHEICQRGSELSTWVSLLTGNFILFSGPWLLHLKSNGFRQEVSKVSLRSHSQSLLKSVSQPVLFFSTCLSGVLNFYPIYRIKILSQALMLTEKCLWMGTALLQRGENQTNWEREHRNI